MQASNLQGDLNIKTVWGDLIVSVSEETSSCLCLGRPHRASVWGDLIVPVSEETSCKSKEITVCNSIWGDLNM